MKLPVGLLERAEAEFTKTPDDVSAFRARLAQSSAFVLDGQPHFEMRRAMLAASAREPVDLAFERYIGTNDLLPVNYLQLGTARSRPVGRVRYFDKTEQATAYAAVADHHSHVDVAVATSHCAGLPVRQGLTTICVHVGCAAPQG